MKRKRINSITERLEVRSRLTDSGCLEWTGYMDDDGYGLVSYKGSPRRVHRVAWELVNGPIEPGVKILHRCDNPSCFELSHLFYGTHQDNMDDRARKGRNPTGENLVRWAQNNPEQHLANQLKGVVAMAAKKRNPI